MTPYSIGIGLFQDIATLGIDVPSDCNLVHTSGFAVTGIGSARYCYDTSVTPTTVAANPARQFLATDGRGFRLDELIVDAYMVGAVGDGATDDTAAFSALFAVAGKVRVPAGTFQLSSPTIPEAYDWEVEFDAGARITSTSTTQSCLVFRGGYDWTDAVAVVDGTTQINNAAAVDLRETYTGGPDTGNPVGSLPAGEPSTGVTNVAVITLASPQILKRGDRVWIYSDDEVPDERYSTTSNKNRAGEFGVVGLDSSGTQITLAARLRFAYETNVRVALLKKCRLRITGFQGINYPAYDDEDTYGRPMVEIKAYDAPVVQCAVPDEGYGPGLFFRGCYAPTVIAPKYRRLQNRPSANRLGYGVGDLNCEGLQIVTPSGTDVRHLTDTGSDQIAAGDTRPEYYGRSRNGQVTGGYASCTSNACYSTHQGAEGYRWVSCTADGTYMGGLSNGAGWTMRGRDLELVNCRSRRLPMAFGMHAIGGGRVYGGHFQTTRFFGVVQISNEIDGKAIPQTDCLIEGAEFSCDLTAAKTGESAWIVGNNTLLLTPASSTVTFRRCTFKIAGTGASLSDWSFLELLAEASVTLEDCTVDISGLAISNFSIFRFTASTQTVIARNLRVIAGSTATAVTVLNASSIWSPNVDVQMIWDHGSNSPATRQAATVTGGAIKLVLDQIIAGVPNSQQRDRIASTDFARKWSLLGPLLPATAAIAQAQTNRLPLSKVIAIDDVIASMKADGTLSALDCLYIFAADNRNGALVNVVNPGVYDVTESGTLTFTPNQGFTSDGSSGYLETHFIPGANSYFVQDSASMAVYSLTDIANSAPDISNFSSGSGYAQMSLHTGGGNWAVQLNDAAATNRAASSAGLFHVSRTDPSGYTRYKNGSPVATETSTSTGFGTGAFSICAKSGGTPAYSPRQIAAAAIGGGLNSSQATTLYNGLNAILTTLGAFG